MHSFFKISRILLVGALLTGTQLGAQSHEPRNVSIEFTTLNWDSSVIQDLKFESSDGIETVTVYNRGLSIPMTYRGPENIVFFRESVNTEGEYIRIPVAQTKVPLNTKEVLFVFQPSPDPSKEYYGLYPIPRDRSKFPRGSYQIFNFSDFTISGKIDDQIFKLDKQNQSIIALPLQKTATIEVKFARNEGDDWKLAYSSLWGHKADNRVNIFLFNSNDPVNPIEIRRYKEFVPAETAAQ